MGRKNKNYWYKNLWNTAEFNAEMAMGLETQIYGMALNRYKWINLPPDCDMRYLELVLFTQGQATIAHKITDDTRFYSLGIGAWKNNLDMYGNPNAWTALGINGEQFNAYRNTGVFIWDNMLRQSVIPQIRNWINELVDILITMRQNRAHQKVPLIISGTQEKTNDLTQYVKQVAGGEIIVLTTDGISNIEARALTPPNAMPFIGDKLFANYLNVWNQIYACLGIDNLQFKQERMIEDEVNSQNDPTNLVALNGLYERRKACDYLNNNFDYFKNNPINVVWNHDNISDNYNMLHNIKDVMKMETGDDSESDSTI